MARDHIAFLADGHLTGDDPVRVDTLVARLEALAASCATVCILGDLFEVWLGLKRPPAHVARVGSALAALRGQGVRTVYVEGNRDFAIASGASGAWFDVVVEREHVEEFGERRYHLSHGDLVNPADRPYRAWRRFAKGFLAPVALAALSEGRALSLAGALERRLRSTNRAHKSCFPAAACRAFARARIAAGADYVVVGHFHHELSEPVAAGERRGTFLSLPFWHAEPRPVLFDREGRRADAAGS